MENRSTKPKKDAKPGHSDSPGNSLVFYSVAFILIVSIVVVSTGILVLLSYAGFGFSFLILNRTPLFSSAVIVLETVALESVEAETRLLCRINMRHFDRLIWILLAMVIVVIGIAVAMSGFLGSGFSVRNRINAH